MFYDQSNWNQKLGEAPVRALVSLTPAESKRLIAKGVVVLPEVRQALEQGIVIIGRGTTNAFVVEEMTGNKIEPKYLYTVGLIMDGELAALSPDEGIKPVVLRHGKPDGTSAADALQEFRGGDVAIKGASAVDSEGNAGVLAAGERGGTIGEILPVVLPRGSCLIVPVGLEKLIPSVAQAARVTGIFRFKYSTGLPAGLVPIPNALVVTEVQAFQILTGVKATSVAAGGIAGSEGTVVLSLEGEVAQIEQALSLVKSIKGELPVGRPITRGNAAAVDFNYDAMAQWQSWHGVISPEGSGTNH